MGVETDLRDRGLERAANIGMGMMTLDQIKAAHPAKPYETEYGSQEGSTSAFVEAVYKSLTAKK